jgi:hypothetical protein
MEWPVDRGQPSPYIRRVPDTEIKIANEPTSEEYGEHGHWTCSQVRCGRLVPRSRQTCPWCGSATTRRPNPSERFGDLLREEPYTFLVWGGLLLLIGILGESENGYVEFLVYPGFLLVAFTINANWDDWADRATESKAAIGTVLMIVGVGVVVFSLPSALRYVIQPFAEFELGEAAIGAGGAMAIGAGWVLRQSARDRW